MTPAPRGPNAHLTLEGRPKLSFPSRREAKAAGRRLGRALGDGDQRAYRCADCAQWHLTKSPKRRSDP